MARDITKEFFRSRVSTGTSHNGKNQEGLAPRAACQVVMGRADAQARRTQIVCTIGPACDSEAKIEELVKAGMNVARLNFSHGLHARHAAVIGRIRAVSERLGQRVIIMQDLQGPKVRIGTLAGGQAVELKDGAALTVTTRNVEGSAHEVSTSYKGLPGDVRAGDRLLLDDGLIELLIDRVEGRDVHTRVVHGGLLKEHKGINLPGVEVGLPILTAKDRADLAFGVEHGVDWLAVSFVNRAGDIAEVKRTLAGYGPQAALTPVIAKIETASGVTNLAAILDAADGVMVARGDLGVELSPEYLPAIQKRIVREANARGKFVITATQMLESMTGRPRPTRAEASDVANAVYDGTDAVMLSAETASGDYPVEAVSMMVRLVVVAEATWFEWGRPRPVNDMRLFEQLRLAVPYQSQSGGY